MTQVASQNGVSQCAVAGCSNMVSKPGHTLCYEHWLAAKNKKPQTTSAMRPSEGCGAMMLSSTQLGERLGISSRKTNQVLAELGWIQKERRGWVPTEQGLKLKAEVREHYQTGIPFVLWPEALLSSRILVGTANELVEPALDVEPTKLIDNHGESASTGFREKFKPTHRATDGHWVRSKAEALIDNWLYMSGLVHAYERLLPIEEEVYCDFYIPSGKVYIEYWGIENDKKYEDRKQVKRDIYKKYSLNLIELNEEHIKNLDDELPKLLLRHKVEVS
jgi:hypothetical protein